LLSIAGAFRLNNGASNVLTIIMLVLFVVYCVYLVIDGNKVHINIIPYALYVLSLALLFMTSLRGWFITGHDIQREFFVFQLTQTAGLWDVSTYVDAYNACLSITILPTIFGNLLSIQDVLVYKVVFQIIFAFISVVVYFIVRNYTSIRVAILSVLYFLAFPTFFADMPMLVRQEIAFLFLALLTYVLFHSHIPVRVGRILFAFFGVGVVLSHYSTTYILIVILFFAIVSYPFLRRVSFFKHSAIDVLHKPNLSHPRRMSLSMVIFLFIVSFMWSAVLTGTSENSVVRVLRNTVTILKGDSTSDVRSNAVLYSLFSKKEYDPILSFEEYKKQYMIPPSEKNNTDGFYSETAYALEDIAYAKEYQMPPTTFGTRLSSLFGVEVYSFNQFVRQSTAKILQVLILVGILFTLYKYQYYSRYINSEFFLLGIGSLGLIFAILIIPVLSVEYGLLRAFQQSLIFISLFAVIGSFVACVGCTYKTKLYVASSIAVFFFLSTTGVFSQIMGGYYAQLNLNNSGVYYDAFYVHESEVEAAKWLKKKMENDDTLTYDVATDLYVYNKLSYLQAFQQFQNIFPTNIQRDSYVFLGYSNVNRGISTISYNGNLISYHYPVQFLENNKDLIYSSNGVRIYY
jgi:uncharacterized membrane protein